MSWVTRAWGRLPRPLDPLPSIKVKIGTVMAGMAGSSALIVVFGERLDFRTRATLPLGVVISLVVAQLLAHGMTAPLREMTSAVRAMAGGDYSRRVRATSRDEVGDLAAAFNRMAADLAEVDRQRREFVANVAHELRTPISALRAVLENVADGITPASPQVISSAVEQTERLGRLISQLLELSRVDAGAVPLDMGTFEVGPFLREATGGRPEVLIDVAPGLAAYADRDRLHQVVANLIDNALRHGPHGGTVRVTGRHFSGALVLDIADDGPGIDPAERDRVFERFSRGSSGSDGGTGLGLAIARWVVQLHHGTIRVLDSPSGCHIRVTLPGGPA